MVKLRKLGRVCKATRKRLGLRQSDVGLETGYTVGSISAFETGKSNNAILLVWYIKQGLKIEDKDGYTMANAGGDNGIWRVVE